MAKKGKKAKKKGEQGKRTATATTTATGKATGREGRERGEASAKKPKLARDGSEAASRRSKEGAGTGAGHKSSTTAATGGPSAALVAARGIDVVQFATSRAQEISHLMKALKSGTRARRVHQSLPRHMRRRATSHNVKRLPVRLRAAAQKEMDKVPKKSGKEKADASTRRRSRRNRRRPSNLHKEYARRAGNTSWLETHIWHAKRFSVETLWGWRVPMHPAEKTARKTHRALKMATTIRDISYYSVFELTGPTNKALLHVLRQCLFYPQGLADGREHQRLMYTPNQSPSSLADAAANGIFSSSNQLIGPVRVLFKPPIQRRRTTSSAVGDAGEGTNQSSALRQAPSHAAVWITAHPAAAHATFKVLRSLTTHTQAEEDYNQRESVEQSEASNPIIDSNSNGKSKSRKSSGENVDGSSSPGECGTKGAMAADAVTCTDISTQLSRFRLSGDRVHDLLFRCLPIYAPENVGGGLSKLSADEEDKRSGCNDSSSSSEKASEVRRQEGGDVSDSGVLNTGKKAQEGTSRLEGETQQEERSHCEQNVVRGAAELHLADDDRQLWGRFQPFHSASTFPPQCTLSLNIWDPRLISPTTTKPFELQETGFAKMSVKQRILLMDELAAFTTSMCVSSLWESTARSVIAETKPHQRAIDARRAARSDALGGNLPPTDTDMALPILLINRPGNPSNRRRCTAHPEGIRTHKPCSAHQDVSASYGSGWDIVLPSAWARELWLMLVYSGARAIGINNAIAISREKGELSFPADFVGTVAEADHRAKQTEAALTTYTKRPPAKRNNYAAMNETYPFGIVWETMSHSAEWLTTCSASARNAKKKLDKVAKPSPSLSAKEIAVARDVAKVVVSLSPKCIVSSVVASHDTTKYGNTLQTVYSQEILQAISRITQENRGRDPSVAPDLRQLIHAAVLPHIKEPNLSENVSTRTSATMLIPIEIRLLAKGTCDNRTQLCVPRSGDVTVSFSPFQLTTDVAHPKGGNVSTATYRAIVGGLTSASFSFVRAQPHGCGFITVDGLIDCLLFTNSLCLENHVKGGNATLAPNSTKEGPSDEKPQQMKKQDMIRQQRRERKKAMREAVKAIKQQQRDARLAQRGAGSLASFLQPDYAVVLAKHPDSRSYRVAILRVLDLSQYTQ